jgi:hypothetical protein
VVLWESSTFYRPNEGGRDSGTAILNPSSGHVSFALCDAASGGSSNAMLDVLQSGKHGTSTKVLSFKRYDPSRFILIQYENGSRRTLDWLCLPDTVDPRGPKGR